MRYVLHLIILNLIIVLKIVYNGSVYQLFTTLPCKQFNCERPSMEKQKFKHLDGVFGMPCFFGNLKICGFVFMRKNLILQLQSSQNMSTYLVNLLELTVLILLCFYLTLSNVKEELLVRGQFHQFLKLFVNFQFINFNFNKSLF